MFPNVNTIGTNWLKVLRLEYQTALSLDTNQLMMAWAKSRIKN
jgi:hypothetical protein